MPYFATTERDIAATEPDELVRALLQAEAAAVGTYEGFVIWDGEYAPSSELWQACGVPVSAVGTSRDQLERWLVNVEAEDVPDWPLEMAPDEYLSRYPDGPNASLARRVAG